MLLLTSGIPGDVGAVEGEACTAEGVTLRLVSDSAVAVPGERLRVGLLLEHEPGYHTYWRSPGIVGMATALEWKLPDGARAGPISWPGPMRTKMAEVTAWGYEDDTCLVTEIEVPEEFDGADFRVEVEVAWMCCARTCHPGFERLAISFPVDHAAVVDEAWIDVFEKSRARVPVPCPDGWRFTVAGEPPPADGRFEAVFALPVALDLPVGFSWDGVYFFCDDNQVDSDAAQEIRPDPESAGRVSLLLKNTAFAPDEPEILGGVLFHPAGWPGRDSRWIRVVARWGGR